MVGMKTADLKVFTGPRKPAKYLEFKKIPLILILTNNSDIFAIAFSFFPSHRIFLLWQISLITSKEHLFFWLMGKTGVQETNAC